MKKVSADTITELTAAASVPGAGGEPPTAEQMIDDIRTRLTLRVQFLAWSKKKAQKNGQGPTALKTSHRRAVAELQKLEKLVANPPNGFRLAPVLYSPIEKSQNAVVKSQFRSYVRSKFLRYLAENHADELEALGICRQGIERMEKGLEAVDPSGKLYIVDVDHIIERGGSGKASLTEEIDPQMPPGSKPTYLVNHFSNFILLPTQVHELKNDLNTLQGVDGPPKDQSKWVLMLVPETGPGNSGYVARPQEQGSLDIYDISPLELANKTASQVGSILEDIAQNPAQKVLPKPALEDMAGRLTTAFNDASKPSQDMDAFIRFYQGEKLTSLRQKAEALPPDETAQLRKTLHRIDDGIESIEKSRRTAGTKGP